MQDYFTENFKTQMKEISESQNEWRIITTLKNWRTIWRKDGSEIGGSRAHYPLHMGETPSRSTEEQSEQPTAPQRL